MRLFRNEGDDDEDSLRQPVTTGHYCLMVNEDSVFRILMSMVLFFS